VRYNAAVNGRRLSRALVPASIRRLRQDLKALREVPERLDWLETLLLEPPERRPERARERWREAAPDVHLTWARSVKGDAFIEKARAHGAFGPGKTIVEVGPGYGRLLEAARRLGVPYERWVGVDLSPHNVAHLTERFPEERFVEGDASTVELDVEADALVSSLTLKHIYPSFEAALTNLAGRLRPGGVAVFDVIEGSRRYFEPDGKTYIRWYTRDELRGICERAGLPDVAFDEVQHDDEPNHRRLLVIARA
jgi:SAM-dependent methyltransferase